MPLNNQTGFIQFIYFTYLHNNQVIAYVILALISLFLLIKKPSRRYIFFFIAFLALTLLFEYQKHIVQDLADQTVNTIFIADGNYKAQWFTKVCLYHLIPLVMWLVGWGCLALGIVLPEDGDLGGLKKFVQRQKKNISSDQKPDHLS